MKHLLILQLIIVNLVGAAGIVAAWPYVEMVFKADTSRISLFIVAIWALGLASCFIRGWKVSRMLDASKTLLKPYDLLSLRYKAGKAGPKQQHLSFLAYACAVVGMFGTVVGLMVLADSIGQVTSDNVAATLAQAFAGFAIALGTTAVGAVCGLWLELNALFIGTATACLEKDVAQ